MLKKEIFRITKEQNLNVIEINEMIEHAIYENGIEELFELIAGEDYIRVLAIGLTHYCFRNGPVESLHAGINPKYASQDTPKEQISQLSESDMDTLNKYMVDKIGFLLYLAIEKRYVEMAAILEFHISFGRNWDSPDIEKERKNFQDLLKKFN